MARTSSLQPESRSCTDTSPLADYPFGAAGATRDTNTRQAVRENEKRRIAVPDRGGYVEHERSLDYPEIHENLVLETSQAPRSWKLSTKKELPDGNVNVLTMTVPVLGSRS